MASSLVKVCQKILQTDNSTSTSHRKRHVFFETQCRYTWTWALKQYMLIHLFFSCSRLNTWMHVKSSWKANVTYICVTDCWPVSWWVKMARQPHGSWSRHPRISVQDTWLDGRTDKDKSTVDGSWCWQNSWIQWKDSEGYFSSRLLFFSAVWVLVSECVVS